MDLWNKATLKALVLPGGLLLVAAALLLQGRLVTISSSVLDFYYYAVFAAGLLLAWRFHSSRVLFALIFLLLGHRAMEFFSAGHAVSYGPGRSAVEAIAILLPLNFVLLSFTRERGLGVPAIAPLLGILFCESVVVTIADGPSAHRGRVPLSHTWTHLPQWALLAFAAAGVVLLVRFFVYRKPVESGLLWSLLSVFLGLQSGGTGGFTAAYFATGGLILVSSIVENSYVLAYYDELTALPGRRAFNQALLRLEEPYSIAAVDIDHFKSFNDTYGHETGDQVLRMVAARLARASGGGVAFRVGGEEFSILFAGKAMKDVVQHLEMLRATIEAASFRMRGGLERRSVRRGPDRRAQARKKSLRAQNQGDGSLSVTVSIGVAEPAARLRQVEQVIQAADKALYRAKQGGRNRVETAVSARPGRSSQLKSSVAG